ncbi:ABC transporter substrate-binding protein [Chelatococcus asaccharovorans]|uniref:ABC-type nitrate/sulfonate/bicarbonate transport system substrate-binding protein n=1 Tax=Chelatococcus asaccharovorans TaxID=28210 RepID=A0A2V3U3Y6_9HYPH|nr:ABC transporter substrate-binding protein [Chelatococcus asaccharovorans]MBS7702911.1 ABC transporter substrate-binding protein [Chelatococcus asaccharovorans]PXW57211.1 ABC-type nitrate/sulfonate/bicarbonate transport system substrate-binding protein [Chelatococcus asaccharovorans]
MTREGNISQIWYTRCPVPTPVGLSVQLGLLEDSFSKQGITLNSIIDSKDRNIRSSHFNHHLDYSFRHGGNVPPIRARSEGSRTRLVGITWTDEFQAIITLPDSGIATTKDLAGRRFGIARRPPGIVDFMAATALKGLVSALSLEGLTPDDVEIVDIPLPDSVLDDREGPQLYGLRNRQAYGPEMAALLRGEVDAIYVKGTPGISIANLFATRTVVEFGFHPDPKIRVNSGSPRLLTVDERLAEERPDLVATLIETLKRTSDWAQTHADEVRRFVAREVGASEEVVAAANGPDLHRHLGIGLEAELVDAVGHYKDFLHEWGFLAGSFDIETWIDRRPWALIETRAVA